MKAPYLEIDLSKIQSNAKKLVTLLGARNIDITGITKCFLGEPIIANCFVSAGIFSLGDSRIENIIRMKKADVQAHFTLIRTPCASEAHTVVSYADVSFNTELTVLEALSKAAIDQRKIHDIVLMVEMGDLREGIPVHELGATIERVLEMRGVRIIGLGANLACLNGVKPSRDNMAEFSRLATMYEKAFGITLQLMSGGNSANFDWIQQNDDLGRVNNLRLGEAILLGRETLSRRHLEGLHLDAITLVAEVIESKIKPSLPTGETGQDAFGNTPVIENKGEMLRSIIALGKQDVHVEGLTPRVDVDILGSSSDHIILDTTRTPAYTGDHIRFDVNYAALLSSMTSPFVRNVFLKTNATDR